MAVLQSLDCMNLSEHPDGIDLTQMLPEAAIRSDPLFSMFWLSASSRGEDVPSDRDAVPHHLSTLSLTEGFEPLP